MAIATPDTGRIHRIPRPRVVTIAIRPSHQARDARRPSGDLPDGESGKFLQARVDFAKRLKAVK
jgi:hypothetical protein